MAQPLLLAVGHALGRAVGTAAEPPALLLGHSVGELAAACLAGVFDPADIGALAAARSRSLEGTGYGGMLAVAATEGQLAEELGGFGEGRNSAVLPRGRPPEPTGGRAGDADGVTVA